MLNHEPKDDHARGYRDEASLRDVLEQAQGLAVEIERLLTSPRFDYAESDTFRIRLARAHTLSLLDQLSELLGKHAGSATRRATRDEEGNIVSGIHPAWR